MKKSAYLPIAILLIAGYSSFAQSAQDIINIDQSGYYPQAPKTAAVIVDPKSATTAVAPVFFILRSDAGDTVFKSKLGEVRMSGNSTLATRLADFSGLRDTGRFVLYVPGTGSSYPFRIAPSVHRQAAIAVLKGFYYIRSTGALEEKYAGKWHRAAGHPDTAVLIHPSAASARRPAGTVIATPGGWYDAGDYNKYIVNAGITTGTLLAAFEDFPAYFTKLNTNIPESGNAVPDILDEALYNMRWMLTMQDPADGGVYNKCTNAGFDGMVQPGVTRLPRYVVQKGTAATLDFAAVMAQGSRIFAKYARQYPGLADSLSRAAINAWNWARVNPALAYNQDANNKQFEPKITTGAYGDRSFSDEWFWAAAELFASTGKRTYFDTLSKHTGEATSLPSWANVGLLGHYTLVRLRKSLPAFASTMADSSARRVVALADSYLAPLAASAFGTVMGGSKREFNWGSNSNAANQGIVLINAYLVTKNKNYLDAALTNVDYLLGRNATGYSFLTGIGAKSTKRPHHRPSVADGIEEPVPGLLAGGPNAGMQDHSYYAHSEPELAYTDTDGSYASNEIAINWNAPAVYLVNAVEATEE